MTTNQTSYLSLDNNVILDAALKSAGLGLPIIIIHGVVNGKCTCGNSHEGSENSIGKHPWGCIPKEATTDTETIKKWFDQRPGCNYGIATGREFKQSGKALVVVDIDSYKEGTTDTIKDLEAKHGPMPDTATTLTGGGGTHHYFLTEIGKKFHANFGPGSGVDVKGIGGYVLGPKSMHRSGKRYETEASSDMFENFPLVDLPSWIMEKFGKKEARLDAAPLDMSQSVSPEEIAEYLADLAVIPPEDRTVWRDALIALKSRSTSQEMFEIADTWSQSSKKKYHAEEVLKLWNSVDQEGGITIKTLRRLANDERRKSVDISLITTQAPPSIAQREGTWPLPEPIFSIAKASPYPIDALPPVLHAAVTEVQGFIKAPMAMVACSALTNLSLAAQALYDVERAETLSGPIGIYLLVIAESGERKTTCDSIFGSSIRAYENKAYEDAKTAIKKYNADKAAWDAIKLGILDAIKLAAKGGKDTGPHEQALHKHEEFMPEMPRVPRLVYSDFTPEALTYSLGKNWPSGGVISSEAGAVLGSHGMGKESQMRTLTILNQLWDAIKLTFDRRGESYIVEGARLTMSLQTQRSALMEFFTKTGTLARGTGFLARFLIARPESTQGTRFFSEPPKNTPALAKYNQQLDRILQMPVSINDKGGLTPIMLSLSPCAKAAWVRFFDEIEGKLGIGGELQEVRDVASKIADNAVRLAALFHVIDNGIGSISLSHFESASEIARWHLNEALSFFSELAQPEGVADTANMNEWLIEYCKKNCVDEVSTRTMSQYAPYKLRDKTKRDAALQELVSLGRIVVLQDGKKTSVKINPHLLVA